MFGTSLKAKTKKVLKMNFGYPDLHQVQKPVFSGIVAQAKAMQVNEYDAAIMFMLSQVNALPIPTDSRMRSFIIEQINNIESVMHLAISPSSDILEMIGLVKANHLEGDSIDSPEFESFESWYETFKYQCSIRHPKLGISDDGSSLVDFMEHESLQRAFNDGVEPAIVAKGFALNFNIEDFGVKD